MSYSTYQPTVADRAALRAAVAEHSSRGDHPAEAGIISDGMTHLVLTVSSCLVIFAGILYALAHLIGDGISKAGHTDSTRQYEIIVANDLMQVPANLIRFPGQRADGALERLDLYLHWPTLSGYTEALRDEFNQLSNSTRLIFLTVEPRSMTYDISGRVEPIYSRFFDGPGTEIGNGLVKQALSAEDGFIDEDLYYEAASPYPFAARCVRDTSTTQAPYCLRDIHIGKDLMVTYRFHKQLLANWMELDRTLRERFKTMLQ